MMKKMCILILIILIIITLLSKKRKEKFSENIISNTNLDFLKGKSVDIVCSGPSSQNIKLKTNIAICPNISILNKQIINNKNIKLIWITEHKFYSDVSYKKKLDIILNKINRDIDYLFMKIRIKDINKINKFKAKIKKKFPNIIIKELDFSKNTYNFPSKYIKQNLFISSGVECINFGISNNVKKMYISGIELGKEQIYSYNREIDISPRINIAIHKNEDIDFINNLSKNDISKLVPVKNSGLFKYLENIKN